METTEVTLDDLKNSVEAIYLATSLDELRKRFIEFGELERQYGDDSCSDRMIDHRKIPDFVTEFAPPYPSHISRPWWSRDDERILVGLAFNEFDMFFVNYDDERI